MLQRFVPPPTHLVRLPEPVVDPEEAKGPARGLVALAAHGGRELLEREAEANGDDGGDGDGGLALADAKGSSFAPSFCATEGISLFLLLDTREREREVQRPAAAERSGAQNSSESERRRRGK